MNQNGAHYLPRLQPVFYQSDAVVHWTLSIHDKASAWLQESFHTRYRELMLHAAVREGLFCPTYCLMPDHIHMLWMGLRKDSDQRNGMAFLRRYLEPALAPCRFQRQTYDHVLGEEERRRNAFAITCAYILNNPVRAELVTDARDWPHCGAVIPGYPELHPLSVGFWDLFWKLYVKARHPDAGNRALPPRNSSDL